MKFHLYSEVFPLLEGAALDELAADIKAFGLREKIWIYGGKILDGRNRFRACQKVKAKPKYRTFKGTDDGALALVISNNLRRRDLTLEQRGFAAARISNLKSGDNQHKVEVGSAEPTSLAKAAERVGVSRNTAKRAKKVLDKGGKALQRAAESGVVSLTQAAKAADLPKSEQLKAATAHDTEPERPDWEPEEDAKLEALQREAAQSLDRVMQSDDRLAAARTEIERQAAEIVALKASRDHYQNEAGAAARLVKTRDRQIEKLKKELSAMSERIAIMETT